MDCFLYCGTAIFWHVKYSTHDLHGHWFTFMLFQTRQFEPHDLNLLHHKNVVKISNEAIDCLGMNLCRLDRMNGAGGGIAVFINNTIPFKIREDLICESFECIWVTIRPTWLLREISRICISCVYLPPCQTDVEGSNEAIDCLGMNLCRLDRTNGAGGGIAVFINNTIPFKVREDLICESFECIWVTIRPTWLLREISRICISCVYLPPCQTDVEGFYKYFYNCYDKLCMESPNSAFIVAGDFNPTSNGFQNRYLKTHCNFKQVVKKATRGNNILDLIFTNIAGFYQVPAS